MPSASPKTRVLSTRRDLLQLLPPNPVIAELGVFAGEFSREILHDLPTCDLTLVDLWSGRHGSGDKDGKNFVRLDLTGMDKLLARSLPARVIKISSTSYLTGLPKESLDAVYIDASHTYDDVTKELNLARTRVRKGGFIMGHDYHCLDGEWDFSGVKRAVDEFVEREGLVLDFLTKDNCQSFAIINL